MISSIRLFWSLLILILFTEFRFLFNPYKIRIVYRSCNTIPKPLQYNWSFCHPRFLIYSSFTNPYKKLILLATVSWVALITVTHPANLNPSFLKAKLSPTNLNILNTLSVLNHTYLCHLCLFTNYFSFLLILQPQTE